MTKSGVEKSASTEWLFAASISLRRFSSFSLATWFTLIDARTWWAIGNFREGQLKRISPGMRADVYVLSKPNVRSIGVVDSIGFGVTPDPDVIGRLEPGLPDYPPAYREQMGQIADLGLTIGSD